MPRGHEHRTARARLEHALRLEPAKLGGRVRGRERRPVGALGRQPHVDLRRRQDARSEIVGVGLQALVVPGPVALLVVRGRDRVQDGERRRAAQHLLGQHRVQLDAIELRPRERPGLVQIEFGTTVVPKSCTSAARRTAVTASSSSPSTRAASAASSAQRRLCPPMYGDLRSMKSAATVRASSSSLAGQHAVRLGLEGEHGVPRLDLAEPLEPAAPVLDEQVGERRVVRAVAAIAGRLDGVVRREQAADRLHVVAEVHDAHRERDRLALAHASG